MNMLVPNERGRSRQANQRFGIEGKRQVVFKGGEDERNEERENK